MTVRFSFGFMAAVLLFRQQGFVLLPSVYSLGPVLPSECSLKFPSRVELLFVVACVGQGVPLPLLLRRMLGNQRYTFSCLMLLDHECL